MQQPPRNSDVPKPKQLRKKKSKRRAKSKVHHHKRRSSHHRKKADNAERGLCCECCKCCYKCHKQLCCYLPLWMTLVLLTALVGNTFIFSGVLLTTQTLVLLGGETSTAASEVMLTCGTFGDLHVIFIQVLFVCQPIYINIIVYKL